MVFRRCISLLKDKKKAFEIMKDVFVKYFTEKEELNIKHPSIKLYQLATELCANSIKN